MPLAKSQTEYLNQIEAAERERAVADANIAKLRQAAATADAGRLPLAPPEQAVRGMTMVVLAGEGHVEIEGSTVFGLADVDARTFMAAEREARTILATKARLQEEAATTARAALRTAERDAAVHAVEERYAHRGHVDRVEAGHHVLTEKLLEVRGAKRGIAGKLEYIADEYREAWTDAEQMLEAA